MAKRGSELSESSATQFTQALDQIKSVVDKIDALAKSDQLTFKDYAHDGKLLKL